MDGLETWRTTGVGVWQWANYATLTNRSKSCIFVTTLLQGYYPCELVLDGSKTVLFLFPFLV